MTETTDRTNVTAGTGAQGKKGTTLQGRRGADVPPETRGNTTVADGVVAKIAGMAAREIPEIYNLAEGWPGRSGQCASAYPAGEATSPGE